MNCEKTTYDEGVSRRNFLAGAGIVAGGVAAAAILPKVAHAEEAAADPLPGDTGQQKVWEGTQLAQGRIVHDPDLCSGCRTCEIVCSTYHDGVASSSRSRLQWDKAIMDACITDIHTCRQCAGPECLAVCPAGALTVDPQTGARAIDEELCSGCRLCEGACPVKPSMIRYDEKTNTCYKCDLCEGDPQCVKFCPTGALQASWDMHSAEGEDDNFWEIIIEGDAKTFAHIEKPTLVLTDASGAIQFDGIVWTSHATQFNIILATFDVTAEAFDKNGNSVGTSDGSAHMEIPEMQSAAFTLNIPTSAKVADLGHVRLHLDSAYVTNAPGQEDATAAAAAM